MKKIVALILTLTMLVSFSGCGDSNANSTPDVEKAKHQLYLDIAFEQNLLFSTYDVELYLDDVRVGLVPHGEHFTKLIDDVTEGMHKLSFYKDGDHSVKTSSEIKVNEDCTYIATIHSNKTSIEKKGTDIIPGIAGSSLTMINIVGKKLDVAVGELKQLGFTNIHFSDDVWDQSNWTVTAQSIDAEAVIDKNVRIDITCEKDGVSASSSDESENTSQEKQTDDSVYYSTNDKEKVKEGNSGIYAYKDSAKYYDVYWVINFDEGYVYSFSEGNGDQTCDKIKIQSGDLNDVMIITLKDENDSISYGLHFKWKRQPDHLILQDEFGAEFDYYTTDLDEALEIISGREIYEWN